MDCPIAGWLIQSRPGFEAWLDCAALKTDKGGSAKQDVTDKKPLTAPLSAVVTDAVRRWFLETSKEAAKGDVVCLHTARFGALQRCIDDLPFTCILSFSSCACRNNRPLLDR